MSREITGQILLDLHLVWDIMELLRHEDLVLHSRYLDGLWLKKEESLCVCPIQMPFHLDQAANQPHIMDLHRAWLIPVRHGKMRVFGRDWIMLLHQ
jgi:hypothetical protein